jgi:DeoR/GlpR family transcriptional regulator of sugar metabolism
MAGPCMGEVWNRIIQERQKTLIARYAALNFIENKDTFILEGGTTVTLMSQFLDNFRELTIITNGLYTATETANLVPYHTVICTGGILRERARTFVGPLAENTFKHFHPRTAFLSATGWTPELGFTDPNLLETAVKRAMLASAQRIVVLLDSSKFGTRSLITSIQTNEVHVVITDSQADRIAVETMRAKGLDVRIVTE